MLRGALVATISLSLLGCTPSGLFADGSICTTPPEAIVSGDYEGCVHRWAYRLSRSPDPARVVAVATVQACETAISWYVTNNTTMRAALGHAGIDAEAFEAMIQKRAGDEALFRVVQARAGHCRVS